MTNISLKRKMAAGGILALMLGCTACSSNENIPAPLEPSNVVETPQTTGENSRQQQADSNNRQEEPEDSETPQNQENPQEPENPSFGWYLENADLQGHVVDFSGDGFTLSPTVKYEVEGGEVVVEAVAGEEDPDSLVTVSYSENIIFEAVTIDAASITIISRETVDKETVKKQSSVLVFGTCQDTRNWTADRVVITRWNR